MAYILAWLSLISIFEWFLLGVELKAIADFLLTIVLHRSQGILEFVDVRDRMRFFNNQSVKGVIQTCRIRQTSMNDRPGNPGARQRG